MENLRLGSRGPDVELLQASLARTGFDAGGIDGVFGPQTQRAVIRFQQSRGINADGVAGRMTWRALRPYITGYTTMTVGRGDTLYAIARRFGTTVEAILTANPGVNPRNLAVGERLTVPLPFPVVFTNVRFTYPLLEYIVEGLTARYPFIRSRSIGRSAGGRDLFLLTVGSGDAEVLYNASHHANEWITTPLVMQFIERYAAAYAGGGDIGGAPAADLYDATTLYLVPMVNPDGVDLVTGAIAPGSPEYNRALAINNPPVRFPEGWKANLSGVDINLNYPAMWERAREIKFAQGYTRPGPRDYVGPAPLSEPESSAMAELTQSRDFLLTISYHTQGEVIYWKFADYEPPRSLEIGQLFADVSGYTLEVTPEESGYAGYKDWFIQTYNRPGYTIEVGRGISPLPLSQFDRIYRDNLGILVLGLQVV